MKPKAAGTAAAAAGTTSCKAPQGRPPSGKWESRAARPNGKVLRATSTLPGNRRRNSSITMARVRATAAASGRVMAVQGSWIFTVCSSFGNIEQKKNIAKDKLFLVLIFMVDQWLAWHRQLQGHPPVPQGKMSALPVFISGGRDCRAGETVVPKILTWTSRLAALALAAASGLSAMPAAAAGWRHEPWCAVFEYDDITWDCSYRTFAECYPNVIGGIRGSCNPNPDAPPPQASTPAAYHQPQKRHPSH